ncbi:MAG: Hpt domain-containing protein, partial [Gammaproteobacteria bacterium]
FVRHKILQADKAPNETELDALADAISSIEYYMESLVDSWGDPTAILDVAEESLRLLGALEAHEPSDEQASVMPTDERIDSEDATLIDMPEVEELELSLDLDDNDDTETELTAPNLDDMINTVLDDDDDTEIDIEAPELVDEDSLVLDSKGLDLAEGLSLEGLEPQTDNRFDESSALSDEITLEHESLEIDFGDALPEAITSDTQEISIAEAFGVERIGEALDLWLSDPQDAATADLLLAVCSHVKQSAEARQLEQVAAVVKDMSSLIEKVQRGEMSLDDGVINTLYMTRDTLVNELAGQGSAAEDKKKHSIEAADTHVAEPERAAAPVEDAAASAAATETPGRAASTVADELDDEIIEIFLEEAEEETANIAESLPRWQANLQDEESLKVMRRSFHTLKGSGRLVGATDVGEFAWAFENMLNRVLDNTITPGDEMFTLLERARDCLPQLFELFRSGQKPPQAIYTLMEFAEALSHDRPIDLAQLDNDTPDISQTLKRPAGLEAPAEIPSIDPALLEIYRKEFNTHRASLEKYLAAWHEGDTAEASHDLIRALHTLNGSSRTAGVASLAELFGTLEKYAKYLQTNGLSVQQKLVELIQEAITYASKVVELLDNVGDTLPDDDALLARVHHALDSLRFEAPTMELTVTADMQAPREDTASESPAEQDAETAKLTAAGEDTIADYDEELVEIFLEEGHEILDESDHTIHDWMRDVENRNHMEALQRQLHTLKGGARMAGIQAIGDLSHSIESMLTAVVEDQLSPSDEMFNVLQQAQDRLVKMLEQVNAHKSITAAPELIAEVEAIINGQPAAATTPDVSAIEVSELPEVNEPAEVEPAPAATDLGAEVDETIEPAPAIAQQPEVVESHDNVIPLAASRATQEESPANLPDVTPEPATELEAAPARAVEARGREQVRVRADLLDNLVNFAGEVSIYRSRLEQQSNAFRYNLQELNDTISRLRGQLRQFEMEAEAQIQYRLEETSGRTQEDFDPLEFDRFTQMQTLSRGMLESLNDLDSLRGILTNLTRESETLLVQQARVNTELQEGLMRTRMVPFVGQVPRLRRIVRQTAQELNKKVELHIEGVDNELDRNVLERILSPIEHMLRNAIAHGIEKPKQRAAAGKPEQGNIYFAVTKEGSDIVIRVRDDGAGIDLEAIRSKAISRGLLKPDVKISSQALLDFILESGFSTASEVTQISGRGVGMDVVNNEIKQLGGILNIDTASGQGTTFSINLPMTLSITRALMVNVGDELFAIPLLGVEGVERVSNDDLKKLHGMENPVYRWLNEDSQFLHLGSVMGVCEPRLSDEEKYTSLLMVRSGDLHAAIEVEGLIGSREIVVKPVGPQLSTLRGISGATIMGDGRVVLILDLGVLIRLANAQREETGEVNQRVEETVVVRKPVVMVVDDSITVRKVTTRLLERNDMEAIAAKDGVDALAQLQDVRPDVLLLDVEMPRMDGFELATNIRNDDNLKHIPIIMITSRTGEKHRDRALAIGVNAYMGKPFNENELLESINSLIAQ